MQNAHVELIMHPRMIDLVNKKWERFARTIFFNRFLVTFSYLMVFLLTTILDQTRIETVKQSVVFKLNVRIVHFVYLLYRLKVTAKTLWSQISNLQE